MSFHRISFTEPKARKQHLCIWCPEKIAVGEKHIHEVSKYYEDFQDLRWHPECHEAASKYFSESGEDEIYPHACKRGTSEEA